MYDTLSIDVLEGFGKKTFGEGFPSDVEQLLKLLGPEKNKHVLEIGCGIGRIGFELIKSGFKYTAVEKQKRYIDFFMEKLVKNKINLSDVELLECSYEDLPLTKKFDVILFSWSIIADFSKEEQYVMLEKAYKHLNNGGICILDNPAKEQTPNSYGTYAPTLFYYDDWKNEFNKLGFNHYSKTYITKTGVKRELTILTK